MARRNPAPTQWHETFERDRPFRTARLRWDGPDGSGFTLRWWPREYVVEFGPHLREGQKYRLQNPVIDAPVRAGRIVLTDTQLRDLGARRYLVLMQMTDRMAELMRERPRRNPDTHREEFRDPRDPYYSRSGYGEAALYWHDRDGMDLVLRWFPRTSTIVYGAISSSGGDRLWLFRTKVRRGEISPTDAQLRAMGPHGYFLLRKMAARMATLMRSNRRSRNN